MNITARKRLAKELNLQLEEAQSSHKNETIILKIKSNNLPAKL